MSTLENEIIASLSNDAAEALAALVSRTETAIVEADAEAKRQEAATWDPQIGPDPRIARDAHEKALVQAGRLRTLLARINRSLAAVAAEERLAAWHKEAAALGEERDNLALEFDQSYAPAVAKLVDLFSRMTALDGKLSQLYLNRPSGVNLSITNPELMARGLERFDRDHPSLLKQVQLIAKSGAQVWPPIVRRDLSSTIPVIEDIRHSPAWHTPAARSAREAEEKANHERLANYYENQKKESEAREAASVAK